jgi:hypothetical protein
MKLRTVLATIAILLLAACTSGHQKIATSSSTTAPSFTSARPSTSPAGQEDAQARAAIAAYMAFRSASYGSERTPTDRTLDAALAATAVRPALAIELGTVLDYQKNGIAFRGTPPSSRPTVLTAQLDASPDPTITVADCPIVSPSWMPYLIQTGQPIEIQYTGTAKPPYQATATVVRQQSAWVVQSVTTRMDATCVG